MVYIGLLPRTLLGAKEEVEEVPKERTYSRFEEIDNFRGSQKHADLLKLTKGATELWPTHDFVTENGGEAYMVFYNGGQRSYLIVEEWSIWMADRKGRVITPASSGIELRDDGRIISYDFDGFPRFDAEPGLYDRIALETIVKLDDSDEEIRINMI